MKGLRGVEVLEGEGSSDLSSAVLYSPTCARGRVGLHLGKGLECNADPGSRVSASGRQSCWAGKDG